MVMFLRARNALLLLAGLCTPLPTTSAFEGEDVWRLLGPFDGDVRCLAVSPTQPDTVYGGRFRQVMRSTDGGTTWDWSEDGFREHSPFIESLLVDPGRPTVLYAGTNRGVFRSEDSGGHWQQAGSECVGCLVWLRSGAQSRFYAIRTRSYELVESRDDCRTWSPVRTFPDYCCLMVDGNEPTTLYVSTQGALHLSRDGGGTWEQIDPGERYRVSAIAVHPEFPKVVYIWSQLGGLRRSQDGGVTWSAFAQFPGSRGSVVPPPRGPPIAFLRGKPQRILLGTTSGLYVGTDDGQHVRIPEGPYLPGRRIDDLAVAPDGRRVYAATDDGVFVGTGGGEMWSVSFRGFPAHHIYHLETVPSRPETMLAMTPGTLFRASEGGRVWKRLSVNAHTFAITPGPDARVVARSSAEGHVAVSSDEGDTWKTLDGVRGLSQLWCRSGSLYGFFQDHDTRISSFRRSQDAGGTWTDSGLALASFYVTSVYANPSNADQLFLGLRPPGLYHVGVARSPAGQVLPLRVARTLDGGRSWLDAPDPRKAAVPPDIPFAAIVAGGAGADGPIYATLGPDCPCASILRSIDLGMTWTVCGSQRDMGLVVSLAVTPGHPEQVIAGMNDGSVFWTADSGDKWQRLAATPDWGTVWDIVVDPHTEANLYLATSKGVFCGRNPVGFAVGRPPKE